jgi:cytochrome c oxidase assembly protein subunit 15
MRHGSNALSLAQRNATIMTSGSSQTGFPRRWAHRVAWLLSAIVLALIWIGGWVTTSDAGMSVPVWPMIHRDHLSAFPAGEWFFDVETQLIACGHTLLGWLSGFLALGLVIVTWRTEPRRWVRWLSAGLLVLVIVEGIWGMLRVELGERTLGELHGWLGSSILAAVVAFCVVTSRWWLESENLEKNGQLVRQNLGSQLRKGLIQWPVAMVLTCLCQLLIGAMLRHIDVQAPPAIYQRLVVAHILVAVFVLAGTIGHWLTLQNSQYGDVPGLWGSINTLAVLALVQFGLGLATWVVKYGWPVWFEDISFAATFVVAEKGRWQMNLITSHVVLGPLILAIWMIHALRFGRVKARFDATQNKIGTNENSTQKIMTT